MTKQRAFCLTLSLAFSLSALMALCLILAQAHGPVRSGSNTLYVAPSGECGTASPCYPTIQSAVDEARGGDTIKVAQGVYTSTGFQVVFINRAITLTGGYSATDWTNSYPITQAAIIDAEAIAHRRGVYIDGPNIGTITLERLTIRRGNSLEPQADGAGVYISSGTVTLRENHILSNTARSRGGGVYIANGTVVLSENVVRANSAEWGGGAEVANGIVTFTGNIFQDNSRNGVRVPVRGNVFLVGNTFLGNTAIAGGGARLENWDKTVVVSNTFKSNSATNVGGGLYVRGRNVRLSGNTVISNVAGRDGGGMYLGCCTITVAGNLVRANSAGLTSDDSHYGGGAFVGEGASVTMARNTILHNESNYAGGGIAIVKTGSDDVNVVAANDVVAANSAPWGGLFISGGALTAYQWTLADNGDYALAVDGGSAILTNSIVASHMLAGLSGFKATADYSLFFNNGTSCSSGAYCTNSLTGDPMFINRVAGDYHIGIESAAVDQGVNTEVATDIDGDPRPMGLAYDIGADETGLIATKRAIPNPVKAGAELTYTIGLTNLSNVDLHCIVTDTLPTHVISGQTSGGTAILPGTEVTWTPVVTAAGGVWLQQFVVTVETGYTGSLVNLLRVTTLEGPTGIITETSTVVSTGYYIYLPVVLRGY